MRLRRAHSPGTTRKYTKRTAPANEYEYPSNALAAFEEGLVVVYSQETTLCDAFNYFRRWLRWPRQLQYALKWWQLTSQTSCLARWRRQAATRSVCQRITRGAETADSISGLRAWHSASIISKEMKQLRQTAESWYRRAISAHAVATWRRYPKRPLSIVLDQAARHSQLLSMLSGLQAWKEVLSSRLVYHVGRMAAAVFAKSHALRLWRGVLHGAVRTVAQLRKASLFELASNFSKWRMWAVAAHMVSIEARKLRADVCQRALRSWCRCFRMA